MRPATLLTFAVLTFIALLHAVRIVASVEIIVNGTVVPMWVSLPAVVLFGGLSIGLWWDHRAPRPPWA